MKPHLEVRLLRLVLYVERHQRVVLCRRRQRAMIDAIRPSFVRKTVLALHPPKGLDHEFLPKIRHGSSLLRRGRPEIVAKLTIAPLEMTILAHNEDRLWQSIHRIVHYLVYITDNAHTVAFKSPLSVMTTFPRERGKGSPQNERRHSDIGIVTKRHERKRKHDDQMNRQIDPRG